MVIIEKRRLTIMIDEFCAAETYTDIIRELLDLLQCKDENFTQQHKNVLLLLENMMLDEKQVEAVYSVLPEMKEE